jgi:hypothetical protein
MTGVPAQEPSATIVSASSTGSASRGRRPVAAPSGPDSTT